MTRKLIFKSFFVIFKKIRILSISNNYAMKPLLLFLVLLSSSLKGQDLLLDILPLIDSKVTYKNVNEVLGNTKIDLCGKANELFDQEAMDLTIDKPLSDTHHFISGTYKFKTLWGPNDFKELYKEIECKVSLTIKNERYQYEISEFIINEPNQLIQLEIYQSDHKKLQKYNKAFYARIDAEMEKVLTLLEKTMSL